MEVKNLDILDCEKVEIFETIRNPQAICFDKINVFDTCKIVKEDGQLVLCMNPQKVLPNAIEFTLKFVDGSKSIIEISGKRINYVHCRGEIDDYVELTPEIENILKNCEEDYNQNIFMSGVFTKKVCVRGTYTYKYKPEFISLLINIPVKIMVKHNT